MHKYNYSSSINSLFSSESFFSKPFWFSLLFSNTGQVLFKYHYKSVIISLCYFSLLSYNYIKSLLTCIWFSLQQFFSLTSHNTVVSRSSYLLRLSGVINLYTVTFEETRFCNFFTALFDLLSYINPVVDDKIIIANTIVPSIGSPPA